MALTDHAIRTAKPSVKPRKLSDAHGLYVRLSTAGSKTFCFGYRFGGKQHALKLGVYPQLSLADARVKAAEARDLLAKRVDPANRAPAHVGGGQLVTFDAWAAKVRAAKELARLALSTLTRFDHVRRVLCALRVNGKTFGQLALGEITAPVARDALRQLQNMSYSGTVSKARVLIGECFRLAMADGMQIADPTSALRGRLSGLAASAPTHVPAATEAKAFAAVLKAIDRHPSLQLRSALQLLALCYPRPGELRAARWRDIDFAAEAWTIPAGVAKARREHLMPLSRQAIAILTALPGNHLPDTLVFPAPSGRPLSKIRLQKALITVGIKKGAHSCHGFRASASTLLRASRMFDPLIIEISLAHLVGSATTRAYDRYEYWPQRAALSQAWADRLDTLRNEI